MNKLWNWFFPKKPTTWEATYTATVMPPFDVMTIPIPGIYAAQIEGAEPYASKLEPRWLGVRLELRLVPDDPEDFQEIKTIVNKRQYVELLHKLGIKRSNDPTVLIGYIIPVEVVDSFPGTRANVLADKLPTPKPKPKRRNTRARSRRAKHA